MKVKNPIVLDSLEVISLASSGKGIAKNNEQVIFIENTYPGDIIDAKVIRKKSNYKEAVPIKYHTESTWRIIPFCQHFGECGGCKIQNIGYQHQLDFKSQVVKDSFNKIGKLQNPNILPIKASINTIFYRNKLEFSFSNNRWITYKETEDKEEIISRSALGFHVPGRFDKIININKCFLQSELSNKIRNFIKEYAEKESLVFYDPLKYKGFLRSLFVRTSISGELMIMLVVGENDEATISNILKTITNEFSEISSAYYMVNPKTNDSVYDLKPILFSGTEFITEEIEHIKIQISPKTFYQTNSLQALELYKIIRKFADLKGNETVYDLYSGVGGIGLFLAKNARKVIGIETVQESVDQAIENSKLNNINNAVFHFGLVEKLLTNEFVEENNKPDILILDPPRAGLHPDVIKVLNEILPQRIIYVSCNPATQARDISLLTNYSLTIAQPVDMFPHTLHVENVALLERN